MDDVGLYHRLVAGRIGADDIHALRENAARSASLRLPLFGVLSVALNHADPNVRAAAIDLLQGADGRYGLRALLHALDDDDAGVRAAAVESLRVSAAQQPLRWAHVLFHPRAEVRKQAIAKPAPSGAELLEAYLLADPENQAELLARVDQESFLVDAGAVPLLLNLFARGALSADAALAMQRRIEPKDLIAVASSGAARRVDPALPPVPDSTARDGFDALFALIAAASVERQRELCAALEPVVAKADATLRARIAVSLLSLMSTKTADLALVRLLAVAAPSALLSRVVPRTLRREAALVFLDARDVPNLEPAQVEPLLAELVPEGAEIDVRIAAALATLVPREPFATLTKAFTTEALVGAFAKDPFHGAPLVALEDDTKRGRKWFLGEISKHSALAPGILHALSAWTLPTDRLGFVSDLDPMTAVTVAIALSELELDPRVILRPNKVRRLAETITARFFHETDAELQRKLFTRLLAQWTALEKELGAFALALLGEVACRAETSQFLRAFLALDDARLVRALALLPYAARVPFGKELALANELVDHDAEPIRAWARERITPAPAPLPSSARPGAGIRALTDREKAQIAKDRGKALDDAVSPFIGTASSGLTGALAAHSHPSPSIAVCLALLGSHDAPGDVCREFERFRSDDPAFLTELDARATRVWSAHPALPLVGTGWLWRWEKQALRAGELVTAMGIVAALPGITALPSSLIRSSIFWALGTCFEIWAARDRGRLAAAITDDGSALASLCINELGSDVENGAASLLAALHNGGYPAPYRLRERISEKLPDVGDYARRRLDRIASATGLPARAAPAVSRRPLDDTERKRIRTLTDFEELAKLCADTELTRVEDAALRLVELGSDGCARLADLILQEPPLPARATLIETIPLWPECSALAKLKTAFESASGELAFRLGLAFNALDRALDAAHASGNWFRESDFEKLLRRVPKDELCRRLATSPQPHAYRNAVAGLLASGDVLDPWALSGLRAFLHAGASRLHELRLQVAERLRAHGDEYGFPLRLAHALSGGKMEQPLFSPLENERVELAVTAALTYGARGGIEARLLDILEQPGPSGAARDNAHARLLVDATSIETAKKASLRLMRLESQQNKLGRVADVFAWGARIAPVLTGRRLRVHMTDGRALGFTRLEETRIYVSPLPILRNDRNAEAIVEGLVLHELGHHRHHRSPDAIAAWKQAEKEGIFGLLNLVADEHLERNLRALEPDFGDRLKQLAAHAFQHTDRELPIKALVHVLSADAFYVLSSTELTLAYDADCVRVSSGTLLGHMEQRGSSFARFFRALRMGLGNRHDDPKVAEALSWFDKRFRHTDMQGLLELARRLRDHFGWETALSQSLGGHELGDENRAHTIFGDDLRDEDVQQEVERVLDPDQRERRKVEAKKGGKPEKLWINVSGNPHFEHIHDVTVLPRDAAAHRELAGLVTRHSRRLRRYLEELGLSHVLERRRLRGTRLDRHELLDLVTHGEPRVLVRREIEVENDLFIGVAVDCSGSMASAHSMDKAKRFAVLLAEAVKDLDGVDLRVFGFTDKVLYDAGDAKRSAASSLQASGGNNDAAALYHVAEVAKRSRRAARLLVMVSDGLPTECSAEALKALATRLERRERMCVAQVAVRPIEEACFRHYVLLEGDDLDAAVGRFGRTVARLVRRALA